MAFIALEIGKISLIQQKSYLEYELMITTDNYNYVTDEIADIKKDYGKDTDSLENNQNYQDLQDYEAELEIQKEALGGQLEELKNEIDSYDKAVSNNIKSECQLGIST